MWWLSAEPKRCRKETAPDPDWLAAKEASEEQAGGSLIEKEKGVVSEFFVGTDYWSLR